MNEVIQLPGKARVIIYYVLGILNVGFLAAQATKLGDGTIAAQWIDFGQQFTAGASALFFGIAGGNVISNKMVATRARGSLGENVD